MTFRDIAFETTPPTFGKLKPCAFHAFQISIKYSISSAKMFQLDAIYYQSCVLFTLLEQQFSLLATTVFAITFIGTTYTML